MRKVLTALLLALAAIVPAVPALAQVSLADRLKGYFLLSVEDKGKIWFVLPDTAERVHVGNAQAAWALIKGQMIGINNENLSKLPQPGQAVSRENMAMRDRLKGKFLLAVEQKGEVWFVNPHDGYRHYLGTGEDTYQQVKKIALGAKLADLSVIPTSNTALTPTSVVPVPETPVPAQESESVQKPVRINLDEVKANLDSVVYEDAALAWDFVSSLSSAYEQFHRDHGFYPEIKWFANVFGWNQPIYMDETGFTLSNRAKHYWEWNTLSTQFFKFYFDHFSAEIETDGNLLMHFDLPEPITTAQHGVLDAGTYHWSAREGLMTAQEFTQRKTVSVPQTWDSSTHDVQEEATRIIGIVRSIQGALNKFVAEVHGYPVVYNQAIALGEAPYKQLSIYGAFGEKYGPVLLDNIENPGPTTKLMYDNRLGGESYAITFTLHGSFRDYKDALSPGIYEARPEGIVRVGDLK